MFHFHVDPILSQNGCQNFFKNAILLHFPRQISFLSFVPSSMYLVGTAWSVRLGANRSRIYPFYLTRVMLSRNNIFSEKATFWVYDNRRRRRKRGRKILISMVARQPKIVLSSSNLCSIQICLLFFRLHKQSTAY